MGQENSRVFMAYAWHKGNLIISPGSRGLSSNARCSPPSSAKFLSWPAYAHNEGPGQCSILGSMHRTNCPVS